MHHQLYLFDTFSIGKPETIQRVLSKLEDNSIILYPMDIDIVSSIEVVSPIIGRAPPVYVSI